MRIQISTHAKGGRIYARTFVDSKPRSAYINIANPTPFLHISIAETLAQIIFGNGYGFKTVAANSKKGLFFAWGEKKK